jgi:hypothetical protein
MADTALVRLVWGNNWKKAMTSMFALAAAIAGAITSVPPAWTAMGLPEVASKQFVREAANEAVKPVKVAEDQYQSKTTIAINKLYDFQRKQYQFLLADHKTQLEGQLFSAQHDPAAASSPIVQDRIRELTEQINDTNAQISAARRHE